jgi:methanogenic corrinoid protein MtbC1
MNNINKREQLITAIANLNEELSINLVKELLNSGEDPVVLVQDCQTGMQLVGEKYENKEYYLAGLIMGGEIFSQAVQIIRPGIVSRISGNESGVVLIGTVEGDIHDLGKNIATMLLRCHRFTVHDIGVDISAETFLKYVKQYKPDVIGLSGLLITAFDSMRRTIKLLRDQGIQTPVIIGGGTIDEEVCHYTGADFWVNSAEDGVTKIKQILKVPIIKRPE